MGLRTPKSSRSRDTHATSLSTGSDPGDDVAEEYVPRDTGHSRARRAMPAEVDRPEVAHDEPDPEKRHLREALARTQSMLEAVQARLLVVEEKVPRIEGQLDVLIRMQMSSARVPQSSHETDHGKA